ncbi:embigin [Amia ocellicauda]|uniref:embigin n=1 Tax=Amia ocellicauda TaxID=2972642 RepID=UPI00346464DD
MFSTRFSFGIEIFLLILYNTGVISDGSTASLVALEKKSNYTKLDIDGHTNPWLNAKVNVVEAIDLVLSCNLTGLRTIQPSITGHWRKDGKDINSSHATIKMENKQHILQKKFQIDSPDDLGNYSCVFNILPEVEATFIIQVPQTKGRDKPLISYVGDSIVMYCESEKYYPINWIWYTKNDNAMAIINTTIDPHRYQITIAHGNKSILTIMGLTEKDSGTFQCSAVYRFGSSEGDIHLNVLTYMVPLKIFLVIAAEVIVLVSVILICEIKSKKKNIPTESVADTQQTEMLKTEENNGVSDGTTTRHRNV